MRQLLLLFLSAASILAGPVPVQPPFKVCQRSDPEYKSCMKIAVQSAITDLTKGSKALNVQSINPLELSGLSIHQGSGPVAVELDFATAQILGLNKVIIESVDTQLDGDAKKLTLSLKADDPLGIVGDYTINGKVLVLPIAGTGDARIDLLGATGTLILTGKTVTKNGHQFLGFRECELNLIPKDAKLYFGNLFNGDKALGDNMNKFLNENWTEIYPELKAPIQEALARAFCNYANTVVTKMSFNSIFPQ